MPRAVPANDLAVKSFDFDGETYYVKSKFPMFKFFKQLNENPVLAMSLALEGESLERLEGKDMDMEDFKNLLESLSQTLAGTNSGN